MLYLLNFAFNIKQLFKLKPKYVSLRQNAFHRRQTFSAS